MTWEERGMTSEGVEITGPKGDRFGEVLTPDALGLVAALQRELGPRRAELLAARATRQVELSAGGRWTSCPRPGPSGTTPMAGGRPGAGPGGPPGRDHRPDRPEDDHQRAELGGEGVARRLRGREHPAVGQHGHRPAQPHRRAGPHPRLHQRGRQVLPAEAGQELATIVVRPRGWHLDEKHVLVDGQRVSGSLFDFALYFFHCARRQLEKGSGPYFYLPKIESHWRPGSGTTRSTWPRTPWASRAARSGPPC